MHGQFRIAVHQQAQLKATVPQPRERRRVDHIGVSKSTSFGRGSERMPSMMTAGMKA